MMRWIPRVILGVVVAIVGLTLYSVIALGRGVKQKAEAPCTVETVRDIKEESRHRRLPAVIRELQLRCDYASVNVVVFKKNGREREETRWITYTVDAVADSLKNAMFLCEVTWGTTDAPFVFPFMREGITRVVACRLASS